MKAIIYFIMLILLSSVALATITITINAPDAYSIQTTTDVLLNWSIEQSATGNDANCTIYNKTSAAANYSLYNATSYLVANGSDQATTFIMGDSSRIWWKIACNSNTTTADAVNTSERIFDVDTAYYTLSFGVGKKINMTLDTGNIVIAGNVTAANVIGGYVPSGNLAMGNYNISGVSFLTATNLILTNLESNIDATGYNVTGANTLATTNLEADNLESNLDGTGFNLTFNYINAIAPNGSVYLCGVNNSGSWVCS